MKIDEYLKKNFKDLEGKVALVTGATSGIGYYEALYLLKLNAFVIFTYRDEKKMKETFENLKRESNSNKILALKLDLSDLDSIREFVKNIQKLNYTIDILINNAGLYFMPRIKTKQNYEITIGTNYLGTFYLTESLISLLNTSASIIFVTSIAQKVAKINLDDFFQEHSNRNKIYGLSKLMISSYFLKLANSYPNLNVYLTHPGVTATNILRSRSGGFSVFFTKLGSSFLKIFTHKKEKAALSIIYPLSFKAQKSSYYGPWFLNISGLPKKLKLPKNIYHDEEAFYQKTKEILNRKESF